MRGPAAREKLRSQFFALTGKDPVNNEATFSIFALGYVAGKQSQLAEIMEGYEFFKREGKWLADAIRKDAGATE